MFVTSSIGSEVGSEVLRICDAAAVAPVTARVTDLTGLFDTQSYTIAVVPGNRPPLITSDPVTAATEGQLYTYDVEAEDPDVGDVLTFSLDVAPTGMTIDSTTGVIIWTPTNADAGNNPVTVRVTDSGGLFDTQSFVIAVGAVLVTVPDVVGLSQANAEAAIVAAGLTVGVVTTDNSDTVPVGDVISQDPTAGSEIAEGSSVDIVVSLGPVLVTVANVVGLSQANAEGAIVAAGLVVGNITTANSDTVPVGDVISQDPTAGTDVAEGSAVDIVVSLGPVLVTVANVVGLSQTDAEAAIVAAGLVVGNVTTANSDTVPAGNVISQDPTAGTEVAGGSAVDIVVSLGPVLVEVPNFVGLSQADAEAALVAAGLTVGVVTTENSDTVPAGDVISQDPAAGSEVAEGLAVDIVVSLGPGNHAPVARNDAFPFPENFIVTVPAPGVLVNDFDPDSDPITATLVTGPAEPGVTIDLSANGSFVFEAPFGFDGVVTWEYQATDGDLDSNVATVTITVAGVNDAPSITSAPVTAAVQGQPYAYDVDASDPDQGDVLAFSLVVSPSGMTIDSVTGVIGWTPGAAQIGNNAVTVRVDDQDGLFATQSFDVDVGGAIVPDVAGLSQANAEAAIVAAGLVVGVVTTANSAAVPAGDVISQSPVSGSEVPFGSAVDIVVSLGPLLVTVPDLVGLAQADAEAAIVAAGLVVGNVTTANSDTVPAGDVISQDPAADATVAEGEAVDLVVSLGPVVFTVPNVVGLSQTDAEAAVVAAGLTVGTISTRNHGTVPVGALSARTRRAAQSSARGRPWSWKYVISQDPAGGTIVSEGSAVELEVSLGPVAGDTTAPQVDLTSPAGDAVLISPADVIGTASDANLFEYRLSLARMSDSVFVPFFTGTVNVTSNLLGVVDPTLTENGMYRLRLEAEDLNGLIAFTERVVRIDGEAKVGVVTLSFVDLQVPVAGIPITITRTYDSRKKTRRDFGVGWDLDISQGTYENNRIPGEGFQILPGPPPFGFPCQVVAETLSHFTEIRLSDHEFYVFRPVLSITGGGIGFCEGTIGFTQVDGTFSGAALQFLDHQTSSFVGSSNVIHQSGFNRVLNTDFTPFEPQQVRLTTLDGRIIDIDLNEGITRLEDRNGNQLFITASGIVSSSGKSVSFTRDAQGRITRITDPNGKNIDYEYDANEDLVKVTDRVLNPTEFTYDNNHNMIDMIDARGVSILRNEYDAAGRLISSTDADDNVTLFDHELLFNNTVNTTTITDKENNVTTLEYDDAGRLTVTDPVGPIRREYTYDADGNKVTEKDSFGNVKSFTYDGQKNLTSETDFKGIVIATYSYASDGKLQTMTDSDGKATSFVFDSNGNVIESRDANNVVTQAFTYDSQGNITQLTTLGGSTTFTYDAFGNLVREQGPNGLDNGVTYDANGNLLTSSVMRTVDGTLVEEVTKRTLDDEGNLLAVVDSMNSTTTFTYTPTGRVASATDARNHTTTFEYDDPGNLVKTTHPDTTFELFGYNKEGLLTAKTDRAGRTTFFFYDGQDNLTRTLFPDGNDTKSTYDSRGSLTVSTDGRGNSKTYHHDENGRVIRTVDALNNEVLFSPDNNGARTSITDPLLNVTGFEYDASNFGVQRLTRTVFPGGVDDTTRTYAVSGGIASKTDEANKTTAFAYDSKGNLTKVIDALTKETTYTYDEVGNRISQTDANNKTTSFEYDAAGGMTKRTLPLGMSET